MDGIAPNLEMQQLRSICAEHRATLRTYVLEWHRLSVEERPRLLYLYDVAFGSLERERQQLALEQAELFRRVELLSIKVQRGEKLTREIIRLVNKVVDAEYEKFRRRLTEMYTSQAEAKAPNESLENADIMRMYRTLAKQLHPDANGNAEQLDRWHQVQQAYADKDAARLHILLVALGADEPAEAASAAWDLERWREEERRLGARLRIEKRKLDRLKREEPFVNTRNLENEQWIVANRNDLERDLISRKSEIAELRLVYSDLTHGLVEPGESPIVRQEDKTFNEDFMDNTYFGGR